MNLNRNEIEALRRVVIAPAAQKHRDEVERERASAIAELKASEGRFFNHRRLYDTAPACIEASRQQAMAEIDELRKETVVVREDRLVDDRGKTEIWNNYPSIGRRLRALSIIAQSWERLCLTCATTAAAEAELHKMWTELPPLEMEFVCVKLNPSSLRPTLELTRRRDDGTMHTDIIAQ